MILAMFAVLMALGGDPALQSERTMPENAASVKKTETVLVVIKNYKFIPEEVRVGPGVTIVWRNDDEDPHSVVAASSALRSPILDQGGAYSLKIAPDAKMINYRCGVHPFMKGRILVVP